MPRLTRMRDALEVQHYAARHADRRLVVVVDEQVRPADLLLDLRLASQHGLTLILVADADAGPLPHPVRALDELSPAALGAAVRDGHVPLMPHQGDLADRVRTAATWAERMGADRLVVVSPSLSARLTERGHLSLPEARARLQDRPCGRALLAHAARPGRAAVVLDGAPGCLFEELFTHHGAGVLIGDPLHEQIRQGRPEDAADIFLLLRADVERGIIRPVDEFDVARTVAQHLVYTIDGVVVATARLAPWGAWAELSRFATRPRYRGRGRARQLGQALLTWAEAEGYDGVFALSVDARMWRFFEGLGLSAADRRTLPEQWQAGYDFARPSRAFSQTLSR